MERIPLSIAGTSPNGREPRVLETWRRDDGRIALWVHSPNSRENGWQIDVEPIELLQSLVRVALEAPQPSPQALPGA